MGRDIMYAVLSIVLGGLLFSGCWSDDPEEPAHAPTTTPSKADLIEFHRQRAMALDSLILTRITHWDSVTTTGTGIRFEILDRGAAPSIRTNSLSEGTVLELHHRFALLDEKVITTWQEDGPMAFELGATDLPAGFHELIGHAALGDSLRAMVPPSMAWGMSGRPPEIPQEAIIAVNMRIQLYTRPT